jgi:hypothetical protein
MLLVAIQRGAWSTGLINPHLSLATVLKLWCIDRAIHPCLGHGKEKRSPLPNYRLNPDNAPHLFYYFFANSQAKSSTLEIFSGM